MLNDSGGVRAGGLSILRVRDRYRRRTEPFEDLLRFVEQLLRLVEQRLPARLASFQSGYHRSRNPILAEAKQPPAAIVHLSKAFAELPSRFGRHRDDWLIGSVRT